MGRTPACFVELHAQFINFIHEPAHNQTRSGHVVMLTNMDPPQRFVKKYCFSTASIFEDAVFEDFFEDDLASRSCVFFFYL